MNQPSTEQPVNDKRALADLRKELTSHWQRELAWAERLGSPEPELDFIRRKIFEARK